MTPAERAERILAKCGGRYHPEVARFVAAEITAAVAEAVAAEREACARAAEVMPSGRLATMKTWDAYTMGHAKAAETIRKRGATRDDA